MQNYKTGELETASYRISKTAWLRREEAKQVENIYQRVHDITGLNMETSEELQVSNYGMGGHYEPHFDFAKVSNNDSYNNGDSLSIMVLLLLLLHHGNRYYYY